jgi:23S rRNA (uracil1939-C5)-methyltransferase
MAYENVIAVESEGFSTDDLKRNLEKKRHRIVRSDTLHFLRSKESGHEKPELIVVDPPRAGLGKEICGYLTQVRAPEIVYVSCDPATLARDLQSLLQSGYAVERMKLIDLFPQTFHMETVTILKRN